jgi:hypothetical protein
MKPNALKAGVVLALVGAAAAWWFLHHDPYRNSYNVRELATWGLGAHLAKTFPGQRVLVFSNPFTRRDGTAKAILETEAAGLRGLKRGLGAKNPVEAVVLPELKPEALDNPRALLTDRECTTPLSFLVAPGEFDKACKEHPECALVVSLIGLPADLGRVECWQSPAPPRFALLLPDLPLLGGTAAVARALEGGKLAAFVLAKPGAPSADAPAGRDAEKEFARRFVLVTPANFEEVRRTYPGLFPRR